MKRRSPPSEPEVAVILSFVMRRRARPEVAPEQTAPRGGELDIEALYRQYAPLIFRRILRFYDEHEAEEVLHEVFVKLMERGQSFRHESATTTWIYRVTTNHCINRLRDSKRRRALLARHHESLFPSHEQTSSQVDRLFWRELWHHIDVELLQLAVLYYLDGMSHEEIAQVYEVSRRTVGNRLQEFQRQVQALAELG